MGCVKARLPNPRVSASSACATGDCLDCLHQLGLQLVGSETGPQTNSETKDSR